MAKLVEGIEYTQKWWESKLEEHSPNQVYFNRNPIEGVEILGVELLSYDEVNYDPILQRNIRVSDSLTNRSDTIEKSFINEGYNFNDPLPTVDENNNLVDGIGRREILRKIDEETSGKGKLLFNRVRFNGENATIKYRLRMNTAKRGTPNSAEDLISCAVRQVDKGSLKPNKKAIRGWFDQADPIYGSSNQAVRTQLVNKVLSTIKSGTTPDQFQSYRLTSIAPNYIEPFMDSKYGWQSDLYYFKDFHPNDNNIIQLVFSAKHFRDYFNRKLPTLMKMYKERGTTAQFIVVDTEAIPNMNVLHNHRDKAKQEYMAARKWICEEWLAEFGGDCEAAYEQFNKVITPLGFVPQDCNNEDDKILILWNSI